MVSGSHLQMQVNLFVSGRKLRDLDTFSKSDPQCILYEQKNNSWVKIGQTEQIKNNLNPDFQTAFTLAYFFEKVQNFKFVMVDCDGGNDSDTIGEIQVTMGKLMGAKKQIYTENLSHQGQTTNRGQIIIRTQSIAISNECAKMTLKWQSVHNSVPAMICCSATVPYFCEIQKEVPGTNNFVTAFRYPIQYQGQNVNMREQVLPLAQICNADKNARIKFRLVASTNDSIELNTAICTVNDLIQGKTTIPAGHNTTVVVDQFSCYEKPTFIDYLRSGWAVSLVAAIDYTASNGEPTQPGSLHALVQGNQYESALFNVGNVVAPYDSDKMFPCFGFGGIPRHCGINAVSHCFAINGNISNPTICGIDQIIQTYRQTLPQIGLGGPTLFAPLLTEFMKYVQSTQGQNTYQILLLLTDGAIHDMQQTIDIICELSELPCSIIIVGVGRADFSSMEELDGDGQKLRNARGVECARDIVQFVEFEASMVKGDLAEQVLREVPDQVCSYMERNGLQPVAQQQNLE